MPTPSRSDRPSSVVQPAQDGASDRHGRALKPSDHKLPTIDQVGPPAFEDPTALPPRSLAELRRLVVKRDGWYAGRESLVPHRVLQALEDLARAKQFPEADLPAAASLVTAQFLATEYARPPRRAFDLVDTLPLGPERDDAARALAGLVDAVRSLGPVAGWGARSDGKTPSPAERLDVLVRTIAQARIDSSLHGFLRFHNGTFGRPAPSGEVMPPRAEATDHVIKQITVLMYRNVAQAIVYQEFADRYPVARESSTSEEMVAEHGEMLRGLHARMNALRADRRVSTTDAMLEVAGLTTPDIPNPTKGFHSMVRGVAMATGWIHPTAGKAIRVASEMGQAIDAGRVGRAVRAPEAAAATMAPVYVNVEARETEACSPKGMLTEHMYPKFAPLVSALMLVDGDYSPERVVFQPGLRINPIEAMRRARREAAAFALANTWRVRGVKMEPFTPVGDALTSPPLDADAVLPGTDTVVAPDRVQELKLFRMIARGMARAVSKGDPDQDETLTPAHVATITQAVHCAAIAVSAFRAGVAADVLHADLEAGRVPSIRGRVGGGDASTPLVGATWEAPHVLSSDGVAFVHAALRCAERKAAITEASRSGYLVEVDAVGRRPGTPLGPHAHLKLTPTPAALEGIGSEGVWRHRAPIRDGWMGTLVSTYVTRYADGCVRVPASPSQRTVRMVRLAPMEAHESMRALAEAVSGAAGKDALDMPFRIEWVAAGDPLVAQLHAPANAMGRFNLPGTVDADTWLSAPIAGYYDAGPDAPAGESGEFGMRLRRTASGQVILVLHGALPPSARDALAAAGVRTPSGHPQPRRTAQREQPGLPATVEADATNAHLRQLAALARESITVPEMKRQLPRQREVRRDRKRKGPGPDATETTTPPSRGLRP